jgi:hypothetical protein
LTPFRKVTELEFLNNLWGLGTEKEYGCCSIKLKRGSKVLKVNRTFFADRTHILYNNLLAAFFVSKPKRMVFLVAEAKA